MELRGRTVWRSMLLVILFKLRHTLAGNEPNPYYVDLGYKYSYLEDQCVPHALNRTVHLGVNGTSLYGILKPNRHGPYSPGLECAIRLKAPDGYRIVTRISSISLYSIHSSAQNCLTGSLSIWPVHVPDALLTVCGYGRVTYALVSEIEITSYKLHTDPYDHNTEWNGFTVYYTAFHEADTYCATEGHNASEFRCPGGTRGCIPKKVTCDGLDNCGDWSDESVGVCGLSTGGIVAISVMCSLLGATIFGFIGYCIYSKKREKTIRSSRQQASSPSVVYSSGTANMATAYIEPPPAYTFESQSGELNAAPYEIPDYASPSYETLPALPNATSTNVYDSINHGSVANGGSVTATADAGAAAALRSTSSTQSLQTRQTSSAEGARGPTVLNIPPPIYSPRGAAAGESNPSFDPLPEKNTN